MNPIQIFGIPKLAELTAGDDLPRLLLDGISRIGIQLQERDILVVTSKAISKVEGRVIDIRGIIPSRFAREIAPLIQKDPRVTELILAESKRIVRMVRGLVITETRHGFICANAGLDQSNIAKNLAVLLPLDPDKSARRIRESIRKKTGVNLAVVVSDTFGRPWREGQTDIAIGVAGLAPLLDYRGKKDRFDNELRVTVIAVADEITSAAELVMGKTKNIPAALIRGIDYASSNAGAHKLVRSPRRDLFR
jgi:coenzyme F420-0:L-glutamate ligase/coenzyme F420-1:gamma-L-glutamate ligase|tara:strand:- start:457 stop:1206 length:750 start_codon:yes stop_codon:yes gene_type:complete